MTGFRYRARSPDGTRHTGVMQAVSEDQVGRILSRQGLILERASREPLDRSFQLRRSADPKALVQFYHQFSALIGAGIPLLRCLDSMTELTADVQLKRAIEDVARRVKEGSTLADALRKHPRIFSDVAVSVLAAAEVGGSVDSAMKRLADYVEQSKAVRDNVRAAMIYPGLIVVVTVAAIISLITLVVPTFESLFEASGVSLPLATRMLLVFADYIALNWLFLVAGFLAAILVGRAAYDQRRIRRTIDRSLLRTPLFGRLITKVAVARVSRTLASLLSSGVGILEALASAARTAGNVVIEDAIRQSRDDVAKGVDLSSSLAQHSVLPRLMADMTGVGEESGSLDAMLGKVADFYEREVEVEVKGLLQIIEPALIVVVGLVLSGLVVAMYLPIFDSIATIDSM